MDTSDKIPRDHLEVWVVALNGRLGVCVVSELMPVSVGGEARRRWGMGYVFSGKHGGWRVVYTVGESRPQRGEISHMSRWHKGLAQFGSELACRPESEEECTGKRAICGHMWLRAGRTRASKAGQLLWDSVWQCRPQGGFGPPTWLLTSSVRHIAADL